MTDTAFSHLRLQVVTQWETIQSRIQNKYTTIKNNYCYWYYYFIILIKGIIIKQIIITGVTPRPDPDAPVFTEYTHYKSPDLCT